MMKTIYLIRHCKSEGQEPEAGLTEAGEKQAQQLADFLKARNIEYIVSSPYQRAIDTIRPFANSANLAVHTDDRLRERVLSGTELKDWMEKLQASYRDPDLKFEGGESVNEAMHRGWSVIVGLLEREDNHMAVVTHGALLSCILRKLDPSFGFEEWRRLRNPDLYLMRLSDDIHDGSIRCIWD